MTGAFDRSRDERHELRRGKRTKGEQGMRIVVGWRSILGPFVSFSIRSMHKYVKGGQRASERDFFANRRRQTLNRG